MDKSVTAHIDLLEKKIATKDWEWCTQYQEELEKFLGDLGFRFVTSQEIDLPIVNPSWWACLENAEGQQFFGFGDDLDPSSEWTPSQVFLAIYRAAIEALKSLLEAAR